VESIF